MSTTVRAGTSLLAIAALPALSFAQAPVIDGTIAGDNYGAARAVQTVQTQFGDNFSELNAAYATLAGGRLNLALTGNIEGNFNKLEIFIHTGAAGGQNVIDAPAAGGGSNPDNDGWAGKFQGFTFDTGFAPNYMVIARRGNAGGDRFDVDFAQLGGGSSAFSFYADVFGGFQEGAGATGTGLNAQPIQVAYDNSNVAGVLGGTAAANQAAALAVQTGLELSIALADLGNPNPADLLVSVMVNGSNHDFLSNQFLGGLAPPQANLGGDGAGNFTGSVGAINLNQFAGNQFFVVPSPGAIALLGLGGLFGSRRRR